MKLLTLFITLLGMASLSYLPTPRKEASKAYDGRYYDTSLMMDFTDSTQSEIDAYYGNTDSLSGEELKNHLYSVIHIKTEDIKKYYVTYTTGVTKWYKITDRNWELSQSIAPETYKFTSDTGNNYYENMLYFADTTTKAKQINTDVNGFTHIDGNSPVDWENKTAPKWTDDSGVSNFVQVDKEHIWVKSHGFSPSGDPVQGAGTDLHHLLAADHCTNNIHNSLYYGTVADHNAATTTAVYCRYADGTSDISGWTGYTDEGEKCFEPTDQYKGNIARALFYMAVNYCKDNGTNTEAEPYLIINKGNSGDDDLEHYHGVFHNLEDFLAWNTLDPVDEYESHRNNLIYKNVQNNRNPFIDHPEWVNRIFDENYTPGGETSSSTPSSTAPSSQVISSKSETSTIKTSSSSSKEEDNKFSLFGLDQRTSLLVLGAIVLVVIILVIIIITVAIKTGHKKEVKKIIKKASYVPSGKARKKNIKKK